MPTDPSLQTIETRTHRAFFADLPDLTGDTDPVPVNLRAVMLQREVQKLRECNEALREVLGDLMELAADDLDLLARARTAYLRSVMA